MQNKRNAVKHLTIAKRFFSHCIPSEIEDSQHFVVDVANDIKKGPER
jgi:hypothetical protein